MVILFVIILFLVVPDVYIYSVFLRGVATDWGVLLYGLPGLVTIVCGLLGMSGFRRMEMMRVFFALMLCFSAPKFLFMLFALIGSGLGLVIPYAFEVGVALGLVFALLSFSLFVYGFVAGWKKLKVREVSIETSDLPLTFDGYRILQISDLHIGSFSGSGKKMIDRLVRLVNDQEADLIVFTGDLVNICASELEPFTHVLSQLNAKDGVFSILGNHDYGLYGKWESLRQQEENLDRLKALERSLGWDLLLNENRLIRRGDASIAIIGVENIGKPPFPKFGDLREAMKGLPDKIYKVLLSHDPSHWRREVLPETDIQLTLSGHTHGMQLRFGRFSISRWAYPEWGGLYKEGERSLYVSLGIGGSVLFRVGAWAEVNVITLRRSL